MDRPIVYIAGPYRGDIAGNIARARNAAFILAGHNIWFHCPHSHTALMDGAAPDEFFLELDKHYLKICSCIYLLEGWGKSTGTLSEIALAKQMGLPIFESIEEVIKYGTRDKV
jgi:hypothetical protein